MKQEKEKKKNVEMAFINVVLYPTEKQKPEEYIKLLSSIMGSRIMIQNSSSSDRSTLLRAFDKVGDYYHGYFCNAIFLKQDSKTLNVKANVLEDTEVDPNKGLEAKDMEFWFYPKFHRFVVYKSNVSRIAKFLIGSFKLKLGDEDCFAINVEKDKNTIERIINAKGVVSVRVSVKYTNNDNCDEWEELDSDLRNSDTTNAELVLKSSKSKPIQVLKNKLLKAFLHLSKSNGTAKAEIINENGYTEKINTNEHPKIEVVDINQNPALNLQNIVENIAQNRD